MTPRGKIDLEEIQASLITNHTRCAYSPSPEEITRIGFDHMPEVPHGFTTEAEQLAHGSPSAKDEPPVDVSRVVDRLRGLCFW
jgi:hypothetical protein